MNSSRLEWKVGLFALVGLALLTTLLLQFSKGGAFFAPTYQLDLLTPNVGAIKPGVGVLLAGVNVGSVVSADLGKDGKTCVIRVKIYRRYRIHRDAAFVIDQSGFLGDQYVSITPGPNLAPLLIDGAVVACQPPFNLLDAARAATGLMDRLDQMAKALNTTAERVDRILLAEQTLVNLTNTLTNFRHMSDRAVAAIDTVDQLIQSNRASVHLSVSNLTLFSERLSQVTTEVRDLLNTNRGEIAAMVRNLESASGDAKVLLADLQAGKGLAGSLLKDEELARQLALVVNNLSQLSSNLNRFGLLYKPKLVKTNSVSAWRLYPGKTPF
jgi:phospholipid/cholesterol/gamma-HCH transport system substrate-binding protein